MEMDLAEEKMKVGTGSAHVEEKRGRRDDDLCIGAGEEEGCATSAPVQEKRGHAPLWPLCTGAREEGGRDISVKKKMVICVLSSASISVMTTRRSHRGGGRRSGSVVGFTWTSSHSTTTLDHPPRRRPLASTALLESMPSFHLHSGSTA
jgi:hypothetical protein